MKTIIESLSLSIVSIVGLMLASCVNYVADTNGFQDTLQIPAISQKAYLYTMRIATTDYQQFGNHVDGKISDIINEVTKLRPDVFCGSKEEGVPVCIEVTSNEKVKNTWTAFPAIVTLGFIPYARAEGWHFDIRARTMEDEPLKLQHLEIATLEFQASSAAIWSLFWPFYYCGNGEVCFADIPTLESTNWFMTQKFADNVAYAAASLLKRLEETKKIQPDSPSYIPPAPTIPKIRMRKLPGN